jgi:hypothetical protein
VARIKDRTYAKILLRNYHKTSFWYDDELFPKSSGIRKALNDNYQEIRLIKGAKDPISSRDRADNYYLFGDVSVLVPKDFSKK